MPHTIVLVAADSAGTARAFSTLLPVMSPTWIWMQLAIVILVLAGMIIAITKLV